jgi:hypothetical protein
MVAKQQQPPPSFIGSNSIDNTLRITFALGFLFWNVIEGAVFENEYPYPFIKLYSIPLWRLLLLAAVISAAYWCPSVGLMLAFATFFYVMDMEVTMDKWK